MSLRMERWRAECLAVGRYHPQYYGIVFIGTNLQKRSRECHLDESFAHIYDIIIYMYIFAANTQVERYCYTFKHNMLLCC